MNQMGNYDLSSIYNKDGENMARIVSSEEMEEQVHYFYSINSLYYSVSIYYSMYVCADVSNIFMLLFLDNSCWQCLCVTHHSALATCNF